MNDRMTATEVMARMEQWEATSGREMREFLGRASRDLYAHVLRSAFPLRTSKRPMKASLGVLAAQKARHLARD